MPREQFRRGLERRDVLHVQLEHVCAHARLELARRAVRDHLAVVDDDDVVGELVGLVEVLGREQHGGAVGDELADEAPDVVARLRVEARRGLVEDQQARAADEARAEVEPAAHATGVAAHDAVAGVAEPKALERVGRAAAGIGAAQAVEPADHLQVLAAGEGAVDRGELAGQTDQRAYARGVAQHVAAEHPGGAGVRPKQRRKHAHERGLARAVRAQEALDGARPDREVDAVERARLAERDGHALHLDCLRRSFHRTGRGSRGGPLGCWRAPSTGGTVAAWHAPGSP